MLMVEPIKPYAVRQTARGRGKRFAVCRCPGMP
jgi:hypothetical protein